jgi:hypothetical protein
MGKTFLVIIFIFIMIAIIFQAFAFIMEGQDVKQIMLEQFTSQPTRASDCRCLPGYVPSNKTLPYEFVVVPEQGGAGFILQGNTKKQFYWRMHNTNFDWSNTKYRVLSGAEIGKYKGDGYVSKEVLEKALQTQVNKTPNFFCQSLSNSSNTKQCY